MRMPESVIALDAMGGDNAPGAACEGARVALREFKDIRLRLFGPKEVLEPLLPRDPRLEVVDAREVITSEEAPMLAVRKKTDASMVRAAMDVREGRAQALVSAGSTGAVLAAGVFLVGRVRGVERPALAPVIPGKDKPFLLIDSGANVDCLPGYLLQFGMMGSVYMERVIGVPDPTVGLVNIGTEADKGGKLYKSAHELMRAQQVYRFVGNVEARDIPMGGCDVAVADGFDGNLLLKYTEGLASAMFAMLRRGMSNGPRARLGALLLKPVLTNIKNSLDYEKYGGAPLLGVRGAIIKAHGSSSPAAFKNAIRQARRMVMGNVAGEIRDGIERMAAQMGNKEEH